MAYAEKAMLGGGNLPHRFPARLIPKRGRVKVTIVVGLLHSFSNIFNVRCAGAGAGAGAHFS